MTYTLLDTTKLLTERAKWAFAARRVNKVDAKRLSPAIADARPGDLVFGRVAQIGQHKRLQVAEGRYSTFYPGDHIVVVCGDRYAPDQFESVARINPEGADLVAAGGICGEMLHAHGNMSKPTRIEPLGLVADSEGEVLNVDHYALPPSAKIPSIPFIVVVGTSMNGGKTTAVASLAHGLTRSGLNVAAIKATGTGAFGDFNAFRDAGASCVLDFTDAGMATTYRQPIERIEDACDTLLVHAAEQGAEIAVVELADGLFQTETRRLLEASRVRDALSGVLFAAPDAMSAVAGTAWLREIGLQPLAVSGKVSQSPLAVQEAQGACPVRVLTREALCDPKQARELIAPVLERFRPQAMRAA